MTAQAVIGGAFVGLGVALMGIAAVGLLRLPDVYTRANAVTKAAGLGLAAVLLGVAVLDGSRGTGVLLVLAVLLQLFTVPVAGFAIAEAAWSSRTPLVRGTRVAVSRDAAPGSPGAGPTADRA